MRLYELSMYNHQCLVGLNLYCCDSYIRHQCFKSGNIVKNEPGKIHHNFVIILLTMIFDNDKGGLS